MKDKSSEYYENLSNNLIEIQKKSQKKFSEADIAVFELINKGYKTEAERDFLANYIDHALGNMQLNKKFLKLHKKDSIVSKKYGKAIYGLSSLSYKTKNYKKGLKLLPKMEQALSKYEAGENLDVHEQLTPEEFGHIKNLHESKYILQQYGVSVIAEVVKKTGLIDLYGYKNENVIYEYEQKFRKEALEHYKNGDILMHVIEEEDRFHRRLNSGLERSAQKKFITKFSHAAQLYKEDSAIHKSEIAASYYNSEFKLEQASYSEIYRMDVTKLMNNKTKKLAEKKLGKNWQEEVNNKFHKAQKELHSNTANFEDESDEYKLVNDKKLRIRAGLADFQILGHTNLFSKEDYTELRDKFYAKNGKELPKSKIICSSFVGQTTIASLVETNAKLNELGLGDNALNIPISRHEKLNLIHPGRIVDLLDKSGCLSKVPPTKIEQSIFVDRQKLRLLKREKFLADSIKKEVSQYKKTQNTIDKQHRQNLQNAKDEVTKEKLTKEYDQNIKKQKSDLSSRITSQIISHTASEYNMDTASVKDKEKYAKEINDKIDYIIDATKSKDYNSKIKKLINSVVTSVRKAIGLQTKKQEKIFKSIKLQQESIKKKVIENRVQYNSKKKPSKNSRAR